MQWFGNSKKIYPTKMFVNYLPETSQTKSINVTKTKSIGSIVTAGLGGVTGVAIEMLATAAPKLIESGMQVMSETIKHLADGETFPTTVKRNFDTIPNQAFSLPSKITLVRGEFANNADSKEGELFGDGETKRSNQARLLANKELHIEIDILKSSDGTAVYFQPTSYFYAGQSANGDSIDEIVLAFAFLPAGKTLLDVKTLAFQNLLHFEALNPNKHYSFKSESGYDHSFQSIWMQAPLSKNEPYTMVIQIQEIKAGNTFAKLLQTVYLENETSIEAGINRQVAQLQASHTQPEVKPQT